MSDPDYVELSRLQFAVTTLFHITWPVLTIGLSLFMVTMEALWVRTGNVLWYQHARFWGRLFLLNFGCGVVTGIPLEFEFGTNWARFSSAAGGFFGNMLGFEGAMAFMLEAGFLGIMVFGWTRVPRSLHLFSTAMVALGASMSLLWILVANSWMQTPAGGHMEGGQFVVDNYAQAILNPDMPWGVSHMWGAALETSLFVVGGASAWHLLRRPQNADFFRHSFLLAATAAIIITPVQIWLGDGSGKVVFKEQPAKGAAIEGHWNTNPPGQAAPWAALAWPNKGAQRNDWEIAIPGVLSWLATGTAEGRVRGLHEFAPEDQPPLLPLLFYAFRIMAGIGFALFLLMIWTVITWLRGGLRPGAIVGQRWLLRAWVAAIPLGYVAVYMGWSTREVGRQPWVIYGLLRTADGASVLPVASVGFTTLGYFLIDATLYVLFITFASRIASKDPDRSLLPTLETKPLVQPEEGHRRPIGS
jgi:cytochrome bd ubiquinol oxidase subunit I